MENTEHVSTNEDLPNSYKNGVTENNTSVNKGISIQSLSSTKECENAVEGEKESKKVELPVVDSPTNGEHESETPNIENRCMLMQPPESLTDPVNELESQASHSKKETSPEISKIHPLVDEKEELSTGTPQILMSHTTSHDVNHGESRAVMPKQEVQDVQVANNVNSDNGGAESNEAPRKFHKNLNYHGTGRLPCASLGDGWTIEQIVRQQGKSAGRYDTYYYSPLGAKIRSKLKLREFVNMDLTNFDYNSGKFIESGDVVLSPKPKMSLLKTEELKTIDRSTENNLNGPSSKQSKKLLIKLPPRKKLFPGIRSNAQDKKKLTKKAKKRKLPLSSMARNVVRMDDDSSQNNPFEVFKIKALSLSSHFEDMKDYDDLIQFAWNFLSIESKTRFNDMFAAENSIEPRDTSRQEKLNCQSGLPGESQEKQSRLDFVIAGNDTSTDASNSAFFQNPLGKLNRAPSDIPMRPQYSSDINGRYHDSILASSSSVQVRHANREGSTPSDNKGANRFCASPDEFKSAQKPHKRKSRVPVYIKQHSNGNEV